jgi:hypothetical protein
MGRLAEALSFICSADHPTAVALKTASESGLEKDIETCPPRRSIMAMSPDELA